ncbi:hypothetical protein Mterra_02617 [Calidithermus terrae]|uniref:Uncharacterized protein n=1 Tax=Calidithermus terrae TaxID=1408545 RepID=A0A399EG52_9DEIN|nr:hypothetical protein [Calidithermus terrae]RIH82543.1 hypothetical protein Mterra_02617 [Calidithermus terrae]
MTDLGRAILERLEQERLHRAMLRRLARERVKEGWRTLLDVLFSRSAGRKGRQGCGS